MKYKAAMNKGNIANIHDIKLIYAQLALNNNLPCERFPIS